MQHGIRTQGGLSQPVIEAVRDGVKHLNINRKRLSRAQKQKIRRAEAGEPELPIKPRNRKPYRDKTYVERCSSFEGESLEEGVTDCANQPNPKKMRSDASTPKSEESKRSRYDGMADKRTNQKIGG